MDYLKIQDRLSDRHINIAYDDYGAGKPVVLIHGWPLSREMWEYQIASLVDNGFRVIAYDRRGFGRSSKPWDGYDYDTLASDLDRIIHHLNLEDIALVGFSMGGGEVVRYFSKFLGARVSKAVLISSVTPFRLKTEENPDGVMIEQVEERMNLVREDRMSFLEDFCRNFFNVTRIHKPISQPLMNYYQYLCSQSTVRSMLECMASFSFTDFRLEMGHLNVPVLIIHGTDDKIVPLSCSEESGRLIPNNKLIYYDGAPHGLFYSHRDKLNIDLLEFLKQ